MMKVFRSNLLRIVLGAAMTYNAAAIKYGELDGDGTILAIVFIHLHLTF